MEPATPKHLKLLVVLPKQASELICAIAFLRALRIPFPGCEVDVVVDRSFESLMNLIPQVGLRYRYHFSLYPGKQGMRNMGRMIKAKQTYDYCFCLREGESVIPLIANCGAKKRIGYRLPGRKRAFNELYPLPGEMHLVEKYIRLLELYTRQRFEPDHHIPESQLERFHLLPKKRRYRIIQPFGDDPEKRMTEHQIHELLLALEGLDNKLMVLTGDQFDHERLGKLALGISSRRVLNLAGKLQADQYVALLKYADMWIGPESGSAHLANAMSIPALYMIQPGMSKVRGPYRGEQSMMLESRPGSTTNSHIAGIATTFPDTYASIQTEEIIEAIGKLKKL
ncbi:MAG: glycosyltransferase family 9 protein [Bacteroidota bacterium]